MVKRNLSCVTLLFVMLAACSDWPPVVETVSDVQQLPAEERAIRCVGCRAGELQAIAQRFRSLDYLYLNSESAITDGGLRAVSEITTLRQVVVRDASRLSDVSFRALAGMPNLRELMLHQATQLSDDALMTFADTSFVTLHVFGATGVSGEAMQELRARMPGCVIRTDTPEVGGEPPNEAMHQTGR